MANIQRCFDNLILFTVTSVLLLSDPVCYRFKCVRLLELLTKTTKVCVAGVEQSKSKYHLVNK